MKGEKDRIAFISHDGKKADMVAFVMRNKQIIDELGLKVIATGTTGKHMERAGIDVYKKYASGPAGGDQQIGSRIVEGKVRMVFFFRDPLGKHPHDVDVSALMRLCDVYNIPLATNPDSAELMLRGMLTEKK